MLFKKRWRFFYGFISVFLSVPGQRFACLSHFISSFHCSDPMKSQSSLKRIVFLLFFVLCIALISCHQPTEPVIIKPSGNAWPTLNDSEWPIQHGDPQGTGKSRKSIVSSLQVDWVFTNTYTAAGIVADKDGRLYSQVERSGFQILRKDGILEKFIRCRADGTPLIDFEGRVFILARDRLSAYSGEGDSLWSNVITPPYDIRASATIGRDSLLYLALPGHLLVFNRQGVLQWKLENEPALDPPTSTTPAFSHDGNILYVPGAKHAVIAVDVRQKKIAWRFGSMNWQGCVVGADNSIYCASLTNSSQVFQSGYYRLFPTGEVRWFIPGRNGVGGISNYALITPRISILQREIPC